MKRLRRLTAPAGRLSARGIAAARRRPRRTAVATLLLATLAILVVGLAIATRPATAPLTAGPVFTVRDGWTLAELERHIESGDVDAITAAGGSGPAQLLARTRTGQVVNRGGVDATRSTGDRV